MTEEFKVITESSVNVYITSNCNSFQSEKRFNKDITVADLKSKLELITGASALSMKISVIDDKTDKTVCELSSDSALLGSYPIDSGHRLQVDDPTRSKDDFENTAGIEKYEMTAEDYSKRTNTVKSFLERNKLGKYNEEEMARLEMEKMKIEEEEKAKAGTMKVGDRCQVSVPGAMTRRGEVKFIGETDFKPGIWIGVKYDEPYGKNDGSVNGKRYFECPDKYGGFVKVENVEVGDFPEEELDLSDDEI